MGVRQEGCSSFLPPLTHSYQTQTLLAPGVHPSIRVFSGHSQHAQAVKIDCTPLGGRNRFREVETVQPCSGKACCAVGHFTSVGGCSASSAALSGTSTCADIFTPADTVGKLHEETLERVLSERNGFSITSLGLVFLSPFSTYLIPPCTGCNWLCSQDMQKIRWVHALNEIY